MRHQILVDADRAVLEALNEQHHASAPHEVGIAIVGADRELAAVG